MNPIGFYCERVEVVLPYRFVKTPNPIGLLQEESNRSVRADSS